MCNQFHVSSSSLIRRAPFYEGQFFWSKGFPGISCTISYCLTNSLSSNIRKYASSSLCFKLKSAQSWKPMFLPLNLHPHPTFMSFWFQGLSQAYSSECIDKTHLLPFPNTELNLKVPKAHIYQLLRRLLIVCEDKQVVRLGCTLVLCYASVMVCVMRMLHWPIALDTRTLLNLYSAQYLSAVLRTHQPLERTHQPLETQEACMGRRRRRRGKGVHMLPS